MLNISTNATPSLFITLYKKSTKEVVAERNVNFPEHEVISILNALNTCLRRDWDYQDEIRSLLKYIENIFDIHDLKELDINIVFPREYIMRFESTSDDLCEEGYIYDDFIVETED